MNKKSQYIGLNKQLVNRREELYYSLKEASIRLGISQLHLYMIERGYLKVKKPELQKLFVIKYKLEEDFFSKDPLLYPTPIENEVKEIKEGKLSKAIISLPFKIVTGALIFAFAALGIVGMSEYPKVNTQAASFYSQEIINCREAVIKEGEKQTPADEFAITPNICLDNFYTVSEVLPIPTAISYSEYWYSSISFFENPENLIFTFSLGRTIVDLSKIPLFAILGVDFGTYICSYETRNYYDVDRVHFYAYEYSGGSYDINNPAIHISADYNMKKDEISYNVVEMVDYLDIEEEIKEIKPGTLSYLLATDIFESQLSVNQLGIQNLCSLHPDIFPSKVSALDDGIREGNMKMFSFKTLNSSLIVWGFLLSVICLALCSLSLIKTVTKKKPVAMLSSDEIDEDAVYSSNIKINENKKDLPKNNWPRLILPETLLRAFIIAITLASSIITYLIFLCLKLQDGESLISNLGIAQQASGFLSISLILMFFLNLDQRQARKRTFTSNFIMFFLGIIFYLLLVIVQFSLSTSTTTFYTLGAKIMNYLPGNIIWGILAINLLNTFLFTNPSFVKNNSKNRIIYRSLAIIPIAYILGSMLYQIGSKTWGWSLPFQVSSLLFTKSIELTSFAILYCLGVYIFKRIVIKKYGFENEQIYENGNRFFIIKNTIACLIIALIGVTEIILSKTWPNNPIGDMSKYLFLTIPFVFLYHPHIGKRNLTLDFGFKVLYAVSMVLGIVLIAGSLSTFLNSL